jgi:hypothetical protein
MKTLKTYTAMVLSIIIAVTSISVFPVSAVKTPKLTVKNTSKGVKASWSKIKGAKKYTLLYKKRGAKKYKTAYSGKKLSFTNDNLSPGAKYVFKVKAKTKTKSSAYSKKSEIMYLTRPSIHAEEYLDMKGIYVSWNKVKGASGYRIYRSLKYKTSYKKIATVSANVKTYLDESVKDPKKPTQINSYKYYVKAYNGSYTSAKSAVKSEVYGWVDTKNLENSPLYLTIKKGQVYKDIYKKLSDNYVSGLFTWKSANKKIAKVDYYGIITGVKKGNTTLTAKAVYKNKERKVTIKLTVA